MYSIEHYTPSTGIGTVYCTVLASLQIISVLTVLLSVTECMLTMLALL